MRLAAAEARNNHLLFQISTLQPLAQPLRSHPPLHLLRRLTLLAKMLQNLLLSNLLPMRLSRLLSQHLKPSRLLRQLQLPKRLLLCRIGKSRRKNCQKLQLLILPTIVGGRFKQIRCQRQRLLTHLGRLGLLLALSMSNLAPTLVICRRLEHIRPMKSHLILAR